MQIQEVNGLKVEGSWHDTGNKEKYLEAIQGVALSDPKLSEGVRSYIANR